MNLFVVPHICNPSTTQPIDICAKMYSHLRQLDLADASQDEILEVDMLIGSDLYWEFVIGETVQGEGGPVAVNTKLGWVLSGPVEPPGKQKSTVNLSCVTTHALRVNGVTDRELDTILRSFWELESLGIQEQADSIFDRFASTIQMKDGKYEVSLPWREYHEPLPDSYDISHRRLGGLLRRLWQDPAILQEYDTIIRDQLAKGIVEEVSHLEETAEVVHLSTASCCDPPR